MVTLVYRVGGYAQFLMETSRGRGGLVFQGSCPGPGPGVVVVVVGFIPILAHAENLYLE